MFVFKINIETINVNWYLQKYNLIKIRSPHLLPIFFRCFVVAVTQLKWFHSLPTSSVHALPTSSVCTRYLHQVCTRYPTQALAPVTYFKLLLTLSISSVKVIEHLLPGKGISQRRLSNPLCFHLLIKFPRQDLPGKSFPWW